MTRRMDIVLNTNRGGLRRILDLAKHVSFDVLMLHPDRERRVGTCVVCLYVGQETNIDWLASEIGALPEVEAVHRDSKCVIETPAQLSLTPSDVA